MHPLSELPFPNRPLQVTAQSPRAVQWVLESHLLYVQQCVCASPVPRSPPTPLSPGSRKMAFCRCDAVSVLQIRHLFHFLYSTRATSYDACPSLSVTVSLSASLPPSLCLHRCPRLSVCIAVPQSLCLHRCSLSSLGFSALAYASGVLLKRPFVFRNYGSIHIFPL